MLLMTVHTPHVPRATALVVSSLRKGDSVEGGKMHTGTEYTPGFGPRRSSLFERS